MMMMTHDARTNRNDPHTQSVEKSRRRRSSSLYSTIISTGMYLVPGTVPVPYPVVTASSPPLLSLCTGRAVHRDIRGKRRDEARRSIRRGGDPNKKKTKKKKKNTGGRVMMMMMMMLKLRQQQQQQQQQHHEVLPASSLVMMMMMMKRMVVMRRSRLLFTMMMITIMMIPTVKASYSHSHSHSYPPSSSFALALASSSSSASTTTTTTTTANDANDADDADVVLREAMELLISVGVPRENLCTIITNNNNVKKKKKNGKQQDGHEEDEDEDDEFHSTTTTTSTSTSTSILPPCHDPPPPPPEAAAARMIMNHSVLSLPSTSSGYNNNNNISPHQRSWIRSRRERYLLADDGEEEQEEDVDEHDRILWFYITHALCALACVVIAALAAGLTMGLLSLDPLLLLIKVRAGATAKEQEEAASLLPIVKQHHLLLVTLLLLNSMANEALPLFLEVLVSPVVAVILSVTLVLFFGEIIPSAIFTGPNKVKIAARMVPLVKIVMALLWPLAYPIAKLLDHVLHEGDEEGGGGGDMFGRGELSALVRIQYEERMAHKKRHKEEKAKLRQSLLFLRNEKMDGATKDDIVDNVGALDFASTQSIKASKKTVERRFQSHRTTSEENNNNNNNSNNNNNTNDPAKLLTADRGAATRSPSIHLDEVSMVEGALSMKTKMALDVYTPLHRMISIPYDMILNERNMVGIYSRGFSRVPVFLPNPEKPKSVTAICGVLMTKQLIVVNPKDHRPLSTLPLACPRCVSPKTNLVDLLNLFQTGKVGHLALVCARPKTAQEALDAGKALPEAAGLMGIITLEDVLEALLQEQIYDESDKYEREAHRIARWATQTWKAHVRRKKRLRESGAGAAAASSSSSAAAAAIRNSSMGTVVEQAMRMQASHNNERTGLLSNGNNNNNDREGSNNRGFNPIGGILQFFENLGKNDG